MSGALEPTRGSLSARLIRACPQHTDCPLECPAREVEDLGEIAGFDTRARSFRTTIKEGYDRWRRSARTPEKPS